MQHCISPAESGMIALMPVDLTTATNIAKKANQLTHRVCEVANINSPSQVCPNYHLLSISILYISTINVNPSISLFVIRSFNSNNQHLFHILICSVVKVVLSGHAIAIECVSQIAKEFGKIRAKRLEVSAPFHCSLMQPAAVR